jgi:hypothetical protein
LSFQVYQDSPGDETNGGGDAETREPLDGIFEFLNFFPVIFQNGLAFGAAGPAVAVRDSPKFIVEVLDLLFQFDDLFA